MEQNNKLQQSQFRHKLNAFEARWMADQLELIETNNIHVPRIHVPGVVRESTIHENKPFIFAAWHSPFALFRERKQLQWSTS